MLDRREFLARMTAAFGGALATPCVSFLTRAEAATYEASSTLFTAEQRELVATATELILPKTDTPGARDAGVADFVEMMLVDWYTDEEREPFLAGLARLDTLAKERTGGPFVDAPEEEQVAILTQMEKEGMAEMATAGINPMAILQQRVAPPAFFLGLKQLTLVGYYTSEVGATQELVFNPIPGMYDGCSAVGEHGRVWRGSY